MTKTITAARSGIEIFARYDLCWLFILQAVAMTGLAVFCVVTAPTAAQAAIGAIPAACALFLAILARAIRRITAGT